MRRSTDGIIHKAEDNPAKILAEKNAVLSALRQFGEHDGEQDRYLNWIYSYVKENPDDPLVQAYVKTASDLRNAGPTLTAAVKPLVDLANIALTGDGEAIRFRPTTDTPVAVEISPEPPDDTPLDPDVAIQQYINSGSPDRDAALYSLLRAADRKIHLARYTGGAIQPEHITGNVSSSRTPIHSQLEGTTLAYHLRAIQRDHPELTGLVEQALRGRRADTADIEKAGIKPLKSRDDAFSHLGLALAKRKSEYAKLYDWKNIHNTIHMDSIVEQALKNTLHPDALKQHDTLTVYGSLHRKYHRAGDASNREEFRKRLKTELQKNGIWRKSVAREDEDRLIDETIQRLYEREKDKAFLITKKDLEGVDKKKIRDFRKQIANEMARIASLTKRNYSTYKKFKFSRWWKEFLPGKAPDNTPPWSESREKAVSYPTDTIRPADFHWPFPDYQRTRWSNVKTWWNKDDGFISPAKRGWPKVALGWRMRKYNIPGGAAYVASYGHGVTWDDHANPASVWALREPIGGGELAPGIKWQVAGPVDFSRSDLPKEQLEELFGKKAINAPAMLKLNHWGRVHHMPILSRSHAVALAADWDEREWAKLLEHLKSLKVPFLHDPKSGGPAKTGETHPE